MEFKILLVSLIMALSVCAAADVPLSPYLYAAEKSSAITYTTFQTANNTTAKLVNIGGEAALLLVDGKLAADKNAILFTITDYYKKSFYPADSEMAELKGYADKFNKSRNAMTQYGPAEKVCYEQGTFLSHKPCSDMASCMATASLVCTISGADGCTMDVLATHILAYSKDIKKLNDAYAKFSTALSGFGPTTTTASLDQMDSAFGEMKAAADETSQSKLRFESGCRDCLGICPKPNFDYASITSGKAKISALRVKVAPFASMGTTAEKVALSTADRIAYKEGEEQAAIHVPRYDASLSKFGSLKAQAVLAKALVAESDFVSAADSFISKSEELEHKVDKRNFDGFDALLFSYESSGNALAAMINNSTDAYYRTVDEQDSSGDLLLQAMWKTDAKSQKSRDGYNALAGRKNALDAKLSPPLPNAQYDSIKRDYTRLSMDAQQFISTSGSPTDSIFTAGNGLERTSIDGAMVLASNFMPISFNERQRVAKFIPPIVLGVIDLSILAVVLVLFVAVFYKFHGVFRNKLAISGWALTAAAFVFVLLIGSVGFYSIVLSAEKYASFSDFLGTIRASDRVAVVVQEAGADADSVKAMRACADQVQSQVALLGKKTIKYYISGNDCHRFMPVPANNSTTTAYDETTGLSASKCLDAMPDVPLFDLRYSAENQPPAFTTVVVKQAIFKGNEAYYAKKPMCDAANVLG